MTDRSKYEQLRITLEQREKVKSYFVKKFTEGFSNYIGCPQDCIKLKILGKTILSSNVAEYRAILKLCIPVDKKIMELEVYPVTFTYHSESDQSSPTYNISSSSTSSLMDSNALTVFSEIYDRLLAIPVKPTKGTDVMATAFPL